MRDVWYALFSWASLPGDDGLTGMVVVLYDARAKGEELIDG